MIYAYIRVSTDKQSVENQRYEINEYCKRMGYTVDLWIDETISSTKKLEVRKFGDLLNKLESEDTIIVSELSRLGRNLLQIMSILNYCMEKDVKVFSVKEGYELGNNINSKVLAFAFGLSAEIERKLISDRTREALARKKAEGVILGRPIGRKTELSKTKLYPYRKELVSLREKGQSFEKIALKYGVNRITVSKFISRYFEEQHHDSST